MSTRVKATGSSNGRPSSRSNRQSGRTGQSKPTAAQAEKRKVVGNYMLGKTIGEGTFGKVKLAIHIPTGEKVAIKILEKARIKDQADVRRVNREIKILKKSRHGNIIQLFEVLDTQNTIYLIMECCEGGEMFDFIVAQKHVAEVQACKFFHQIVDGVDVLHKNDITHRDLKPENLLLKASTEGWLVKIVDFGLSNTHEGGKLLTTACGSPCYAAPEMIAGKKYNGPSADIWSMGVILFALVSGYLPFEDANTSVLYKKILSGDYTPPKWLSSNVKDLMRRILETDPRKRYTLEDIRKHPWYNQVSDADIPKDDLSKEEQELTKTEVLKAIDVAGINKQAVLDGIASHCCNSLTAMYYLLEQKHRAQRLKETDKNGKQIQQNESNISNVSQRSHPETQTENNPTNGNVPVAAIGMKVQTIQEKNASNPIASKSLAMNGQQISQATKPAVPLKPYLQAPPILQQHMRQQQQYNNSNPHQAQPQSGSQMPSLDIYMQQAGMGNTLLAESDPVADNNSMQYQSVTKNNAGIPSLNLAAAAPQENRIFVSQTARAENAPNNLNMIVQPLSARPVLSSELANMVKAVPAELRPILGETFEERPNTRRSRNRSRGTPAGDLNGLVETMDSVAIGPLAVVPTNVAQNIVAVAAEISPTKIKTGSGLSEIHTVDMKFAAQAPNQPARSANAGRRGKNIQAPTGGSTNPSPRMMAAQIRKNQQGANAIFG